MCIRQLKPLIRSGNIEGDRRLFCALILTTEEREVFHRVSQSVSFNNEIAKLLN